MFVEISVSLGNGKVSRTIKEYKGKGKRDRMEVEDKRRMREISRV